jgi:hypothetical protein
MPPIFSSNRWNGARQSPKRATAGEHHELEHLHHRLQHEIGERYDELAALLDDLTISSRRPIASGG